MAAIRAGEDGVVVSVLVVPNARRTEIVGLHGDRIKVRLACPPEKNRANAELEKVLAAACGVRRAEVVGGRTHRGKEVAIPGVDLAAATDALTTPPRKR